MGNTATVGEREVTRTRTLQIEERTSDGLVEVTDVGDDEASLALMRELGWQRIIHGTAWPAAVTSSTRKEEVFVGDRETASASTRGLNGSPGFTPAGELEVGTPEKELYPSERIDELANDWARTRNSNSPTEQDQLDAIAEYLDEVRRKEISGKSLSEKLDELLPREIGKHGNGSVAGVAATVAVLVEVLNARFGRSF